MIKKLKATFVKPSTKLQIQIFISTLVEKCSVNIHALFVTEYCDVNWEHVVVESKKESSWLTILQYIAVSISIQN